MITVHHLENSRSQRVLWLLEEPRLPFEVLRQARDPKTLLAPPELRKVHPPGKSPVVVIDDEGMLAESGAIVRTLAERHPVSGLLPAAERRRARAAPAGCTARKDPPCRRRWPWCSAACASRRRRSSCCRGCGGSRTEVLAGFVQPRLATRFDRIESQLAAGPWFAAAAFSVAGIRMSFPLEAAASRGATDAKRHPRIAEWLACIHARPA